ncbi:DUF6259 domain-containing protein [Alicyclobacillus fodiniaquatilis]|uniref:DUF6259 domain-containing protein n=1 Tax=Alicyclobacillus fodiniaquatilis TaxID=1661150 RepID=A0ABW4JH71_9BACL
MGKTIRLANGSQYIEFDEQHGNIVALGDVSRGISLVRETRLAENFRILLPLAHWRGHYISGKDQMLSSYELTEDECMLVWDTLTSREGNFPIRVTLRVKLQSETFTFSLSVENNSEFIVEETIYPAIGGLANFEESDDWMLHAADWGGKGREWTAFKTFPGTYLGPENPVWIKNYESLPWIDLYDAKRSRGVYIGVHDKTPRHSAAYAQLFPGINSRAKQRESRWPKPVDMPGTPIGMMLGWSTFPFLQPGETLQGAPIVVHFHDGTWREGADFFRQWFDNTVLKTKPARTWLTDEDAWQSTIISYPEDSIMYRFSDLPKLAEAALHAGIHVLQIDGWDVGGIDRGYPQYEPDPRLGTWDDLADAIRTCQEMGVRVLLFANLQWANIETEWFQNELKNYAVQDPRGFAKNSMGWEYHTTLGLTANCESRMVVMNPAHSAFQDIILRQLEHIVKLGADGIQLDKMGTGGDGGFHANIDYHPDFADCRDRSLKESVLETVVKYRDLALKARPDFAIASESHWDRLTPFVEASYARFFDGDHLPTFRYAFPNFRQTCCITGPTDFELVNLAIQYGYILNIEGRCLHGNIDDMPILLPYVKEVLQLRRRHKDVLWDSQLISLDNAGVQVTGDVSCCVHQSLANPSDYALVVSNHTENNVEIKLQIEGVSQVEVEQPYATAVNMSSTDALSIASRRFAVIFWSR